MKKRFILSLLFLSTTFLVSCNNTKPITTAKEGNVLLDIIEINDLHGYANEASKTEGYNLANINYYIEEKRQKENNEVILIANGDMFEGTAFSGSSLGLSTLNIMNQMNFDMMGIGNHEFSWGLDSILKFFDNNKENGEANFPLVNGNIYSSDKRYGEDDINDNILPYTIVEKDDIKVGLISYIGNIASSIAEDKLENFKIKASNSFFKSQVVEDCNNLKKQGADFIIFNIHGGNANSIDDYDINNIVAELKDENGNYYIDAIINGHTHSRQSSIKKRGKNKLPMVQGGSYCDNFGEIVLEIDKGKMEVVDASSSVIKTSSLKENNKDNKVQTQIDIEYDKIKDSIDKIYCNNKYTISRENLGLLFAKELRIGTSADLSIMNTGGIRASLPSGNITYSTIYDSYPFENHIVCLKVKGIYLNDWIEQEKDYYYMDYEIDSFDYYTIYNVTTIDYVFESSYFKNIIKSYEVIAISNTLTPRDFFINDLENRGNTDFSIYDTIKVTVKGFGDLD